MNGIEFAGVDESREGNGAWKATTLDLDGTSAPAICSDSEYYAGLAWDSYPPAGMDIEPSCGFGSEAPDGRAVSACFSSLDELENNQHSGYEPEIYRRPMGRGKFCGRCCVRGVDPKTGRTLYRRINCGGWTCSYCGPRRASMARKAIQYHAESLNLCYFLTLTMDPKKLEHKKFAVPMMRLAFNKFREYLRRMFGEAPRFISVLEFTAAGVPHLHILFDRYIPQAWVSRTWDTLGGGRIVFIKKVKSGKVARYLSKYLTKDIILSAPKGSRRITASRSIKLFPKFVSGVSWEFLKSSIWYFFEHCKMRDWALQPKLNEFISVEFDEEKFLKAFQLHNVWTDKGKDELCVA